MHKQTVNEWDGLGVAVMGVGHECMKHWWSVHILS